VKDYTTIKKEIEIILKPKRFKHSLDVEKAALNLARIYNEDDRKCRIAAIIHDCAKNFSDGELIGSAKRFGIKTDDIQNNLPDLLHGPVGAMYAKENFGIEDEDVLNAVCYHTTGRPFMSKLEKIIYLADIIEVGRRFPEVDEIRKASLHDLDKALILACDCTLNYIIKNNSLIHPLTIEFRNSLLLRGTHKNG
jgi:predicted HD superfamily hydrolase involved in NAD metabolism